MDRGLVGDIDVARDVHAGVVPMGEGVELGGDQIGQVADGAGGAQRPDDRAAEGAGAPGDDNMAAGKIDHDHDPRKISLGIIVARAGLRRQGLAWRAAVFADRPLRRGRGAADWQPCDCGRCSQNMTKAKTTARDQMAGPRHELAMITAAQCRSARTLLGWSVAKLASAASVSESLIDDFELERRTFDPAAVDSIRRALEAVGVVFLPGDDVRLRPAATI